MNKLFIFLLVISDFVVQASNSQSRLSISGIFPRDGWRRTDLTVETSKESLGYYIPDVPVREFFLKQPQNWDDHKKTQQLFNNLENLSKKALCGNKRRLSPLVFTFKNLQEDYAQLNVEDPALKNCLGNSLKCAAAIIEFACLSHARVYSPIDLTARQKLERAIYGEDESKNRNKRLFSTVV